MKNLFTIKTLAVLLFTAYTLSSQNVILSWDTASAPNLPSFPSSFNDPGLLSSTVIRGEGLTLPVEENLFRLFAASGFTVSEDDAFREGDYLEFEIEPTSGNQVNLSSLRAQFRRNNSGPREFLWQFKLINDCAFSDIESAIRYEFVGDNNSDPDGNYQPEIDLSTIPALQNVAFPSKIIVRLYAWDIREINGANTDTFGLGRTPSNESVLFFTGSVEPATGVSEPDMMTTWDGANWDNGIPSPENRPVKEVIIAGDYNTENGDILACNLIVNETANLHVANGSYVEVINNVVVNGDIFVDTKANFVQRNSLSTFSLNGSGLATVSKETSIKKEWFHYTYWGSPVINQTINEAFEGVDQDRIFKFLSENYIDTDGDNVDDDANDWVVAPQDEVMEQGVGYIATSPQEGVFPRRDTITFTGEFNTGDITTDIFYNSESVTGTWNLIGNPYPSAIDFDLLYAANSDVVDGIAYIWTQSLPLDANNPGNEDLNFNRDDYAMYNVGVGGIVGANNMRPEKYIPSGQSFFIEGLQNGQLSFSNSMRAIDHDSNLQFFKTSNKRKREQPENKIWINLTSGNTIFNEILIGYVFGASQKNDGLLYDAPRISADGDAFIYTSIEGSDLKFAIQGRHLDSIKNNDIVDLGFKTINDDREKFFRLSISEKRGDFLATNVVYLKDNLLNITHNLSSGSYNFTSTAGDFKNRFQIKFKSKTLSNDAAFSNQNNITVYYLNTNLIEVRTNNVAKITNISLYDILGKQLQTFEGENKSNKILNLENHSHGLYILKMKLSNGNVVSKKILR